MKFTSLGRNTTLLLILLTAFTSLTLASPNPCPKPWSCVFEASMQPTVPPSHTSFHTAVLNDTYVVRAKTVAILDATSYSGMLSFSNPMKIFNQTSSYCDQHECWINFHYESPVDLEVVGFWGTLYDLEHEKSVWAIPYLQFQVKSPILEDSFLFTYYVDICFSTFPTTSYCTLDFDLLGDVDNCDIVNGKCSRSSVRPIQTSSVRSMPIYRLRNMPRP